ncbi:MAG: transposase [bacterium]|nr:transposase [bacterium]
MSFKDDLFFYLRDRWAGLFGSTCDVVLFDLTSTYFEVDGIKALWKMISVSIPGEGEDVTLDSFTWHLNWAKIREARRNDEGTYLLRTNLMDCAPKTLWKKYMIQGEIEYAFREMKHDLGLRPVYHQLDDRIEAHIFTSFMAFCLLTTLRAMAREHAPGLTPRQIIANLKTIKMVDVVMPTTDGRVVTLPRSVEPKEEVALLLNRLGLTLPDQPPPKISESPSAT